MSEARLLDQVRQLFAQNGIARLGDDCAVLDVAPDRQLTVSTDLYHAGVHFPATLSPEDVAWHCLAAAISDLAATGASPLAMTLALSAQDADWLEALLPACFEVSRHYHLPVIGGDISTGPVTLSVTVMGQVPEGGALTRAGARAGDEIWVSGYPGEAAAGLRLLLAGSQADADNEILIKRFCAPEARLDLGRALLARATAAIDISDGLLTDLQRLLHESQKGAVVDVNAPPVSNALAGFAADHAKPEISALVWGGGDDYELCFTAPVGHGSAIEEIGARLNLPLTRIGLIQETPGLVCREGQALPDTAFWQHFPPSR